MCRISRTDKQVDSPSFFPTPARCRPRLVRWLEGVILCRLSPPCLLSRRARCHSPTNYSALLVARPHSRLLACSRRKGTPPSAMQKERLEGWMVQQIEHADLAKETILQLPTRPRRTPQSHAAPHTSPPRARRPVGAADYSAEPSEARVATAPASLVSPRHRNLRLFGGHARTVTPPSFPAAEPGGSPTDRQWRTQFRPGAGPFQEGERVDRTKVLRGYGDLDDRDTGGDAMAPPVLLWGLPREQVLDYIRQSLLPSSWVE